MSWSRILLVLAAVMCAACDRGAALSNALDEAFRNATTQPVGLAAHATFPWDRVCVFRPYSTPEMVDRLSGVPGAAAHAHGIESRDDGNVLLFVAGRKVARSVVIPLGATDFEGESTCHSRPDALFEVRTTPIGRVARVVKRPK